MPWGHFVYQFFDADDRLLYVGITERISYRWSSHGRKAWWKDVARAEVFAMESRFDARDTERWVIKTNDPIHNLAQKERR
jgi:excinuclease UvrABC nuclease subunit